MLEKLEKKSILRYVQNVALHCLPKKALSSSGQENLVFYNFALGACI